MNTLQVWHGSTLVGTLQSAADQLRFTYAAEWLAQPEGFALSAALPRRAASFEGRAVRAFFANLLPDGALRELLARACGLSVDNDFALLKATGAECAGALVLGDRPDTPESSHYRLLSEAELAQLAARDADVLGLTQRWAGELRLSLAGAQQKVAVLEREGHFALPVGTAVSSHILKFESERFKHLPANEVWTTLLAARLGIEVPELRLLRAGSTVFSVAARYDRRAQSAATFARLHQQDMCQALGKLPSEKYEAEGGPSLTACFALLQRESRDPLGDTAQFLRRTLFNLAVGNADAHGKNTALLHQPGQGWRLAPAYDLVCTAAYPRVSRKLAMAVGGEASLDRIDHTHLAAFAREAQLGPSYVQGMARELCEAVLRALPEVQAAFLARYGRSPVLERCLRATRKQARGLRARLD